jgi:VIT1/CCC1 family predicted Fe2+/Mn2+ transporter
MISKKSIQTEVDAGYLYGEIASREEDPEMKRIFEELSDIERGHALAFLKESHLDLHELPKPSLRARILNLIGKIAGNDYVLGVLLDTEKGVSSALNKVRKERNSPSSITDNAHVFILQNVLNRKYSLSGSNIARLEKRHHTIGGNSLRASVLGGNDGLVSNFSLVMGFAGATSNQHAILLAGISGLLAGALSMALGEWISVKSSQELYENQIDIEKEELDLAPEGEEKELALIYQSKGLTRDEAEKLAREIIADKDRAHAVLIKEELGINPDELKGSPMQAAISSFILFSIGAIIPVIPFFFTSGMPATILSAVFSGLGLFFIGAAITLFTGKSVWYSGFRQLLFGLAAAAVTYGMGTLIGA